MSVVSAIFNKGTIKLLVALAIPAAITWVFLYAQQEANREVEEYKQEQKDNPTTERVTVNNYELKEVDDANRIRWQLVAAEGILDQNSQQVMLKDVKVEYYDPTTRELKMRLIAPAGEAHESNRYVKLSGGPGGKVIAEGQGGKARLESKTVELTKKNRFTATGGVNIILPEVAKVQGDRAEGTFDSADLSNFKIVGNTHAEITVK